MHPSARLRAVCELLDMSSQRPNIPADALFAYYVRQRRYIGAKDKAYLAGLFYYVIRHEVMLQWVSMQHTGQEASAQMLVWLSVMMRDGVHRDTIASWCVGEGYGLERMTQEEYAWFAALPEPEQWLQDAPEYVQASIPAWFYEQLQDAYGDDTEALSRALLEEAPTDLRTNTLKTTREALLNALATHGIVAIPITMTQHGIRLSQRSALFSLPEFTNGWFEVQDAGSQMIAELVEAQPKQCVIDFCAGAGGKTLALAAAMQNKGKMLAWDTNPKRMEDMPKRLRRAGVDNVEWRVIESERDPWMKRHKDRADAVLVDAPCTGTGTWRRNPDLKRKTTPEGLVELCATQAAILDSAARLVKQGGRLVYATCSLLPQENQQQIEPFLARHPEFALEPITVSWNDEPLPYVQMTPHEHGTDGFFVVRFKKH